MNIRLTLAAAAALTLPLSAQIATVKPGNPKIKWDEMDLGPFFTGCYKVKDSTAYKGIAVAVGTKEAPAAMLYDTELLRFYAAWEGGLANFARGRGGLEGQIRADGDVKLSTGWALGCGAEIVNDPRPNHQGNAPGVKWRGVYVNGGKSVLLYSVGKQVVHELPGSEMQDGTRVFTRTFTVSAGNELKQILLLDSGGQSKPGAGGGVIVVNGDTAVVVSLRSELVKGKIVTLDKGRVVLQLPAITPPATFQIAMAAVPAADADKVSAALNARVRLPDVIALSKPGPAIWGAALESPGKLGDSSQAYAVDEIPFPASDPFKSWFRPGGHDFLADGTCVIANMSGDVWLVSGLDDTLAHVKWKRFASGLFQPLGCKVVDGTVYVLGRDQITRLLDFNHDGEADFYESFNHDCVVTDNYHEFALDLQTDSKGNFYYAKGSPWTPTNTSPHQGTMLKVSKDGAKLEIFATGLRAPNGLGMGPGDVLTCSDNQGHWMPANRLNIVKQGGFYGMTPAAHRDLKFKAADGSEFVANPSTEEARQKYRTQFWENSPMPTEGYDLPLVWLPMDIDNSPGGEVWAPAGKFGPWAGRMLHMSYGKCSLFGVMQETVDGVEQGAVVRFPLKFQSGIQRGRFSPKDGQLYLTGLNVWQSNAARDGCFERVRYTGKTVAMPVAIVTKANGVDVTFSAPLDASAGETANWDASQWNYKWSPKYGSPDVSVLEPNKSGKDLVFVEKASLSADKKTVSLQLADRAPAMTLRLKCNTKAADGAEVKFQIDQTVNRIPGRKTAGP
jgi:hypothetical protein